MSIDGMFDDLRDVILEGIEKFKNDAIRDRYLREE
jgi:hypothetical protein